jgi:hypothetical protein
MTLYFSQAVLTDRLEALTRALDAGTSAAKINIYSGPRPAPGASITSQTLLASVAFQKPSSGGVVNNVLTLKYVAGAVLAVGTGVAVWARFVSGANTYVADMDVSPAVNEDGSPGTGEVQLDNTQIYAGGSVTIVGVASLTEQ